MRVHHTYLSIEQYPSSCHRCNKAIKIASKSVRSFSVRENWALYELVMAKNKSDRLHNEGCYHKGQYNVTFFCTKGLSIQTNKRMATSASLKGLSFTFMYLLLCKESKVFPSIPFYFLLWQASCGEERSRHICQLNMGSMNYYFLTSPSRWIHWEAKLYAPIFLCVRYETFCSWVCGEC